MQKVSAWGFKADRDIRVPGAEDFPQFSVGARRTCPISSGSEVSVEREVNLSNCNFFVPACAGTTCRLNRG